jgi:nicotinamidase-related amidase
LSGLPHGPLPRAVVHICVDMQRLFREGCSWAGPAPDKALPGALRLTRAMPERTVFTRFTTPPTLAAAPRSWRRYYERWRDVVLDQLDPKLLDIVPELDCLAAPERTINKTAYTAFEGIAMDAMLGHLGTEAVVLSGVETDMCVLATLMGAVDRGYRCVIAEDAVASSVEEAHEAALKMLKLRLAEQVEIASVDDVLAALPSGLV